MDADNGWIVGRKGTILKTIDGGANWTPITGAASKDLRTVFFISADTGWVGGEGSGGAPLILKTTDGGGTWIDQSIAGASSTFINDIEFRNDTIGWAVTATTGKIFYTEDGGTTWVEEQIDERAGPNARVNFLRDLTVTPNRAFAGGEIFNTGSASKKYALLDRIDIPPSIPFWAGDSSFETDFDDNIFSVFLLNDSVAFAGGLKNKLYILENTSNENWSPNFNTPDNTSSIKAISFADENNGWFLTQTSDLTQTVVFWTDNAGENWIELPRLNTNGLMNKLFGVKSDTEFNVWVVGFNGQVFKAVTGATSVRKISALAEARVFPNPVSDQLTLALELKEGVYLTMDLYNNLGQQVRALHQGQVSSGQTTMQFGRLEELPEGLYYLRVHSAEGEVNTFPFVKN